MKQICITDNDGNTNYLLFRSVDNIKQSQYLTHDLKI